MHDFSALLELRTRLAPQVMRLRREQLGLTHEEVASIAKRKQLRAAKLLEIEDGRRFLSSTERGYLEEALKLPAGYLDDGLLALLEESEDPASVSPELVLARLSEAPATSNPDLIDVPACMACHQALSWMIRMYGLGARIVRSPRGPCVCEGAGREGDSSLLLRLAVWLSKARDVLILGGGQDVADAASRISFAEVRVVRGKPVGSGAVRIPDRTGFVVVARGEIGHSTSEPFLQAVTRLPKADRPAILDPRSSNLTAIAEEILFQAE